MCAVFTLIHSETANDRETESDAYAPIMQVAQAGSKRYIHIQLTHEGGGSKIDQFYFVQKGIPNPQREVNVSTETKF